MTIQASSQQVPQPGVDVAELTENERQLGAELFMAVGRLGRWSARHNLDRYGPGVMAALATVVDVAPIRLGELAHRVGVLPASMSRTVATLESGLLVERTTDPDDGRCSFLVATTEGTQLVRDRRRERGDQLASRLAPISPAQAEWLRSIVQAIDELAQY